MNPTATAAALLTDNPQITEQELTEFVRKNQLDPKAEDQFWVKVRELRPTLCADWQ